MTTPSPLNFNVPNTDEIAFEGPDMQNHARVLAGLTMLFGYPPRVETHPDANFYCWREPGSTVAIASMIEPPSRSFTVQILHNDKYRPVVEALHVWRREWSA